MPVSAFTKYQAFSEHFVEGVHDFDADTLRVILSNTAPDAAADAVKADAAEIAAGNGYAADGYDTQNTTSRTGGVTSVIGVDMTALAAGGAIADFRYAILMNKKTVGGIVDPLIGWWDYGAPVTLADTESLDIDLGASMFTVE